MRKTVDTVEETDGSEPPVHDHAWRRVSADEHSPGRLGTFRCDLCSTDWSM